MYKMRHNCIFHTYVYIWSRVNRVPLVHTHALLMCSSKYPLVEERTMPTLLASVWKLLDKYVDGVLSLFVIKVVMVVVVRPPPPSAWYSHEMKEMKDRTMKRLHWYWWDLSLSNKTARPRWIGSFLIMINWTSFLNSNSEAFAAMK